MMDLNVLFVGGFDPASVGYYMAEALKQNNIKTNVVTDLPQKWELPNGKVVRQGFRRDVYEQYLKDADVVVMLNGEYKHRPFGIDFPQKAVKAVWFQGTNYRSMYHNFNLACEGYIKYAHWDLVNLGDNFLLTQPIDTKLYQYVDRSNQKTISIGHIPSNLNVKGTKMFYDAMQLVKKKYDVDIEIAHDIPHNTVMEKKKKYHIYFDQILQQEIKPDMRRGYGLALVEAGAYGSVCLAGVEPEMNPIISVIDAPDIASEVCKLIDDPVYMNIVSQHTRSFIEKYHSYGACVRQFLAPLRLGGMI